MTPRDKERYSRQVRYAGIGEMGQERLLSGRAAIVGCGALGSFHAGALARAGVGTLVLVDRDYVDISNLQRQWLFEEQDAVAGLPKAVAAERAILRINSACQVDAHITDLTAANIDEVLGSPDVILDGTDNFETRYLINDYALAHGIPWIYGAAVGSYGLVMPILPDETACLRCVYPEPPPGAQPTCETAGVLNTITSLIASLQATEAVKLLSGRRWQVSRTITTADLWKGSLRQIPQPGRDPDCPACGRREFSYLLGKGRVPVSLCGRNAVQIHERSRPLDLPQLAQQLQPLGDVRVNEFALRFFPAPYEMTIFPDGRAIIKGTTEVGVARSLYAQYIGQ